MIIIIWKAEEAIKTTVYQITRTVCTVLYYTMHITWLYFVKRYFHSNKSVAISLAAVTFHITQLQTFNAADIQIQIKQ